VSHAALAEVRVGAVAAGGDDEGREAALEEAVSVVEAGTVDGRGPSRVLRGAKNNDGVGRLRFIARRLRFDPGIKEDDVGGGQENEGW
jgi:hypothetical protein